MATFCKIVKTWFRESTSPFCKIGIEPSCAKAAEAQDNKTTNANEFRIKGFLLIYGFQKDGLLYVLLSGKGTALKRTCGDFFSPFSSLTSSFFGGSVSGFSPHAAVTTSKERKMIFVKMEFMVFP
mgnify:FL=1